MSKNIYPQQGGSTISFWKSPKNNEFPIIILWSSVSRVVLELNDIVQSSWAAFLKICNNNFEETVKNLYDLSNNTLVI